MAGSLEWLAQEEMPTAVTDAGEQKSVWTPTVALFALIFLCGSVAYSLGPAITQWALARDGKKLGAFGMFIFTIGGILWGVGFQNMPFLLATPLLTVVLILNIVFGRLINKEKASCHDLGGNLLILVYVGLLVLGQPTTNPFQCRFVTPTCVPDELSHLSTCDRWDEQFRFLEHEVVLTPAFLCFLGGVFLSIGVLGGMNLYLRRCKAARRPEALTDYDMDNYRLSFSTIGGVLGGLEDMLILIFVAMARGLFAGCWKVFFTSWLVYADLALLIVAFPAQIWGVARGTSIAGAKLSVTLELMSHQFTTLAGLTLGLRGFLDFDSNMLGLHWYLACLIFSVTLVFGIAGCAVIMRGFSFRARNDRYTLGRTGSIHVGAAGASEAPASLRPLDQGERWPGLYRVAFNGLLVTSGLEETSQRVGTLSEGAEVSVVEVADSGGYTRGRIEAPAGWIHLGAFHTVYAVQQQLDAEAGAPAQVCEACLVPNRGAGEEREPCQACLKKSFSEEAAAAPPRMMSAAAAAAAAMSDSLLLRS